MSVDTPRDIRDRRISPVLALGGAALLAMAFIGLVGTAIAIKADRLGTIEVTGAFAGACAAIVGAVLVATAAPARLPARRLPRSTPRRGS